VRVGVAEPADLELREAAQFRPWPARGEEQDDRFGQQPPGDEAEDLRRGPVQPLSVVDQAEQRLLLRGARQQVQHRQPDQELIRRGSLTHPERRLECLAPRRRKPAQPIEQGRTQLVQRGEGQLHLGLDADRAQHPHAGGGGLGVVEQRRLPDPGGAAQYERPAFTGSQRGDHLVQPRPFRFPAEQPDVLLVLCTGRLLIHCYPPSFVTPEPPGTRCAAKSPEAAGGI
jgi:hypothetical protein